MTRPEVHADLNDYARRGTTIFGWQSSLGEHPEVEQWIVKAKLEARKRGYEIDFNEVRVPLTFEELQVKLVDAQEKWEKGLRVYDDVVTGSSYGGMTWAEKAAADYYAEREGLVHPSKIHDTEEVSA